MSEDAKAESKREFLRARADDIKVREQIRQKDSVSIEQVKKDLIKEEQELKIFFDPAANASANPKPSDQQTKQGEDDPTVIMYNRNLFGWGLRLFGVATGIVGGGIYGVISSTEYTLRKLEALGPDYQLGRMAINEIEDFRMDKKKFNRV